MDAIARHLGRDPLEIRKLNLYGKGERNITPYHQTVEDNVLPEMIAELETSADYAERRRAIAAFNAGSRWLKKGLALTPVKFGISFTTSHLNQAGALVHIYTDGSIHLNHGGTEMGQGLFIKVAQVVAEELQVDLDRDQDHRHQHRQGAQHLGHRRLLRLRHQRHGGAGGGPHPEAAADRFRRCRYGVPPGEVVFLPGPRAHRRPRRSPSLHLVNEAYLARISLSATGYYATPKIHYDRSQRLGPSRSTTSPMAPR